MQGFANRELLSARNLDNVRERHIEGIVNGLVDQMVAMGEAGELASPPVMVARSNAVMMFRAVFGRDDDNTGDFAQLRGALLEHLNWVFSNATATNLAGYITIGATTDALVRPRTAPPADGVPRAVVLHPGSAATTLSGHAEQAGLRVVCTQAGDDPGEISGHDLIPAFDILVVDLPADGWQEAFGLALRFLRVRRPGGFLLVSQGGDIDEDALLVIHHTTERVGYRISAQRPLLVGGLPPGPLPWPPEPTPAAVLKLLASGVTAQRA